MNNEEIAKTLGEYGNRIHVSEHRIDDLEEQQKQMQDLTMSVQELALSVKSMVEEQRKQAEQIEEMRSAPARQWSQTKRTIFTSLVSAVSTVLAGGVLWLIRFVIINM